MALPPTTLSAICCAPPSWQPAADCQHALADDDPSAFKVLTYNLGLLPRWIPRWPDPVARAALLPQLIQPGYDALVFQEIFDSRARALLLEGLSERGYLHHSEIAGRGLVRAHSGLSVVSRWPIVAQADRTYSGGRSVDRLARKGALHVTLRKKDRTYHLLATHPQSDVSPSPRNTSVRAHQFLQLRTFLDERALDPGEPVLIVGDLNVDWFEELELRGLLETLQATWPLERSRPSDEKVSTFDPRNQLVNRDTPRWLDYVLVSRRHLQPISSSGCLHIYRAPWGRRGRTDLSDHYAVSCSFEFPAGERAS